MHSPWLSPLHGEVWLKVEGDNPTGSFKDRGMTVAISLAVDEGAKAVVCASTGNTSASMTAYAARAGLTPIVLVPHGQIAAGKMAQAVMHGAEIIQVRGNFDDCLRSPAGARRGYPVALVNSVNPMRLEGQKTAAFEIVDRSASARHARASGRQRRQHLGVLAGLFASTPRPARCHQTPDHVGLPGRRRGAAGNGAPVANPETVATAIRIGNPASWTLAEQARDESGGRIGAVTDEQILEPSARSPARRHLRRARLGSRRGRPAGRRGSRRGRARPDASRSPSRATASRTSRRR